MGCLKSIVVYDLISNLYTLKKHVMSLCQFIMKVMNEIQEALALVLPFQFHIDEQYFSHWHLNHKGHSYIVISPRHK